MKEILNVIHNTIYQFIDVCNDDEEVPMSDKDKLLLEVNKAICNNLKALEQQPCEEDILKFYYVESLDDYWIGKRLDTMYYAEWNFDLQAFVWTHSKYLPWGEHVVAPNTLWKEYTYPSEPKEIPFGKWIKGFLKKHGEQQPCEDCISREATIDAIYKKYIGGKDAIKNAPINDLYAEGLAEAVDAVWDMPSITPTRPTGKWIEKTGEGFDAWAECSKCGCVNPFEDDFNYCPNCGARMTESEEEE